ncbi:HAD-IA family hydrolase [Glaciecola sp. MH2013]|nr:HAD-IA family hydrolase [Glaciecola sp. MH2013]
MTFDLDDTLYDNWPYIVEAEKALLDYIAQRYPDAAAINKKDWQSYKMQALRADPRLFSDMGVLRKQVLNQGLSKCGYKGQDLSKAVDDCFDYFYHQRSNFTVPAAKIGVLEQLAEKLPLAAITNGNVNLKQIGIAHCFAHVFKSSINSPMKPHPHMFNAAVDALDIAAHQVLHVGDNLEKDVFGATNAGLISAWHACDRPMDIRNERVHVLPHVEIHELGELLAFT